MIDTGFAPPSQLIAEAGEFETWSEICLKSLFASTILSALLTWDFPAGEGEIEVALDGGEAFFLIFGALMLVFGWIMREAATIDEENRQFV